MGILKWREETKTVRLVKEIYVEGEKNGKRKTDNEEVGCD